MLFSTQSGWYDPNPSPLNPSPHPENQAVFGSMRDYWWQTSREHLLVTGQVINEPRSDGTPRWILLDHDEAYYDGLSLDDPTILLEAQAKARDSGWAVDGFDKYVVIYAQSSLIGSRNGGLFPHALGLNGEAYIIGERMPDVLHPPDVWFTHIGPHTHEFAHTIGFSDEYCPDNPDCGQTDPEFFDVMSKGLWNGKLSLGECPAQADPYYRVQFEWVRPIPVDSDRHGMEVTYNYANPIFYRIEPFESQGREVILFETRLREGFDLYTPDDPSNFQFQPGTLLIWRINLNISPGFADRVQLVNASGTQFAMYWFFPSLPPESQSFNDFSEPAKPLLGRDQLAHIALNGIHKNPTTHNAIIDDILIPFGQGIVRENTIWSGPTNIEYPVRVLKGACLTIAAGSEITITSTPTVRLGSRRTRMRIRGL